MESIKRSASLIVVIVTTLFLSQACRAPRAAPELLYEQVALEDGVYIGSAKRALGSAKVEVTVKDGRIDDVRILRGFSSPIGRKAYREIPQRIVAHRSVEVDAVTGATYSSDIIKAAVREALEQASPD
jgi:uncharacterized protein with FMN-binding domain